MLRSKEEWFLSIFLYGGAIFGGFSHRAFVCILLFLVVLPFQTGLGLVFWPF
jgi:predicted membrane chloride channel (bestrophin family)